MIFDSPSDEEREFNNHSNDLKSVGISERKQKRQKIAILHLKTDL